MAQRAAAMLPPELLHGGEIIVLLLKPSPWYIVLAPLQTLVALAVGTLAAALLVSHTPVDLARRDVILLGVALIGLRLFWQLLEWLSRVYVLTDQRVIAVAGVIRIAVFQARHGQVQHTHLTFSLRERLFRLGTIGFATAGTAAVEAVWRMIPSPLETHQEVVRVINRYRR